MEHESTGGRLIEYNATSRKFDWTPIGREARQIVAKHAHLKLARALHQATTGQILSHNHQQGLENSDGSSIMHVCRI